MTESDSPDQRFINKLTGIILANLGDENFGVKELLSLTGLSYFSLSRRLQSITGKNINQFIREKRLERALDMLQNEEVTSSEVAYRVGFGSATYFNTCFHEFYGYTPGEIKKRGFKTRQQNGLKDIRPAPVLKKGARQIVILAGAVILLITSLTFIIYLVLLKRSSSPDTGLHASRRELSVAVLPFKNLSDSVSNQYFIDGLMEEILTKLSRIHDLRIISRTSVEQFRESRMSVSSIARKLQADYFVEGSGQKYGNIIVLRIQLIEAQKDRHIWAESYEMKIEDTKDIIKIQNQIAQDVAVNLKATITPEEKRILEQRPTASLTAYDYYLRGGEELRRYKSDPGNKQAVRKAEDMYRNALAHDSAFAQAYTGLAEVYLVKHLYDTYFSENYFDSVLILANRALAYNDKLAEAYYARGQYYLQNGKTEQAIDEYSKALKYNPNYWEAYSFIGEYVYLAGYRVNDFVRGLEYLHNAVIINRGTELPDLLRGLGFGYLVYPGCMKEAKIYFQEALNLDRDTTRYIFSLATIESYCQNYPKAIELYEQCYARDTGNIEIIEELSNCYYLNDQSAELLKCVKKFENRLSSDEPLFHSAMKMIAYAYWKNGYEREANDWFKKQISISEKSIEIGRYYSTDANYDLAATYAFLGEKEKAYRNLRKVNKIQVCPLWLLKTIKSEPLFNGIRSEPEFRMIVSDLEAKYQAEHERVRRWIGEEWIN